MRKTARILMSLLLGAGLWLALKPTSADGNPRLNFLPFRVSEYLDLVDFWFNLAAFAVLTATGWLAFSPRGGRLKKVFSRACWIIGIITLMNISLEVAQGSIPGRAVDGADVWAGLCGCVAGVLGGLLIQRSMDHRTGHSRMPKVLFIDQTGKLGGAELMLLDIAAARAADSEVVLFQDGPFRTALEAEKVKTHVFTLGEEAAVVDKQAGLARVLRAVPALIGLILRVTHAARRFDVVYANTAKALIIGGPAAWLAKRALVFHLHDIVSAGHFSTLNRKALIFGANAFAKAVIANSEATKVAFIESGGRAELCEVVPNGFKISDEVTSQADMDAVRATLQLPSDGWVVLMAGRLTAWKGQKILLDAVKSVPSAHVVLLGDALFTAEDRAYAEELHQQAAQPDLAGRIHFAGFRTDTRAFFDLADVVVHASIIAEPFGRVIVEGMLAGKPVIATRAGGAAEILDHEQTGLLVQPGDATELTQALLRLKTEPAFAADIAENAKRTARATYGLEAVQSQIEAVVRQTVRREPPAAEPVAQTA